MIDLASLPGDSLRLYIWFQELTGTRLKISLREVSVITGVPEQRIGQALQPLIDNGYLTQDKGMKFTLDRFGNTFTVHIVKQKSDVDDAITELVNENAQLTRVIEESKGDTCGLGSLLPDAPARVFRIAESIVGQGLTNVEIFYLTELIVRYGCDRVIQMMYSSKKANQPLRATYVKLKRGAAGKPFNNEQKSVPDQMEYPNLDNVDPWGR